ncbi:hypothetical protein [Paenibacillus sp. CF384]|uniref:hypothetical protein n=1 Tax=Paenibacillus sp. CF384 TaxID=1884382 RepID=UPI0008960431|nr:hypothetical protein [Paenibacillus sp. CF384]SDW07780.1 hypothetical protein SAMN05518855_1001184 [Paenibacillus sp. CF384]
MVAPFQVVSDVTDCPSPNILSVCANKEIMFAAAFGKGIFRKNGEAKWLQADDGLPEEATINRLQVIDNSVFACTKQGLFYYDANKWYPTDITIPCYQIVKRGPILAAATEYGIWYKIGTQWKNIAYQNMPIYDLLLTPHYYLLGSDRGITLYDVYTDSWADFTLGTAVTSLAVFNGRVVGVSMGGGLVQGDQKGGFTVSDFDGISIYALKSTETGLYACTSQGLYRLQMMGSRVVLHSMLTGYPVTEMCSSGECMYVSTISCGLKKVVIR